MEEQDAINPYLPELSRELTDRMCVSNRSYGWHTEVLNK